MIIQKFKFLAPNFPNYEDILKKTFLNSRLRKLTTQLISWQEASYYGAIKAHFQRDSGRVGSALKMALFRFTKWHSACHQLNSLFYSLAANLDTISSFSLSDQGLFIPVFLSLIERREWEVGSFALFSSSFEATLTDHGKNMRLSSFEKKTHRES